MINVRAQRIIGMGFVVWDQPWEAAALADILLARQQPEFPSPEHIGIDRLQVFMMQGRWFGKPISDPYTEESWELDLGL